MKYTRTLRADRDHRYPPYHPYTPLPPNNRTRAEAVESVANAVASHWSGRLQQELRQANEAARADRDAAVAKARADTH